MLKNKTPIDTEIKQHDNKKLSIKNMDFKQIPTKGEFGSSIDEKDLKLSTSMSE